MNNYYPDVNFTEDNYDDVRYACTAFFSHKWQLSILMYLFSGPKFFGEILHHHEGLSKNYLSTNLRKLESKGVIKRTMIKEGLVVKVQYSLTPAGKELGPILNEMAKWGAKYSPLHE